MSRGPVSSLEHAAQECGWFGVIPADWSIKPLKFIASMNDEVLAEDTKPDVEIQYVDISAVNSRGEIDTTSTTSFGQAPSRARRRVRHGDTIVSTVRTYLRAITRIVDPAPNLIVSTGFAVIRPRRADKIDADYLGWMLRSSGFVEQVVANSVGVSYPAIAPTRLGDISVPVPPMPTQQAIAAFLDRETARFDALIAKKQRLIELLREKRQAIVNRAATKGIDPNVPMKDSGVEWIGEIPAQWRVTRLKHAARRVDVGIAEAATHAYCDQGVPILRSQNVNAEDLSPENLLKIEKWFADRNRSKYLRTGDIVSVRTGEVGRSLVIPQELDMCHCFTMLITTVDPDQLIPEFAAMALNSNYARVYFSLESWGTAQQNISVPILSNAPIVVPPLGEQRAILDRVGDEIAAIADATAVLGRSLERAHERRAALIAAAVIGKIDVRCVALAVEPEAAA